MRTSLRKKNVYSIYEDQPISKFIELKPIIQVKQKDDTVIKLVKPEPARIFPIKKPEPISNPELGQELSKHVPQPKVKKQIKSSYRASGMDILEAGDQIKKLKSWEDFSSFLAKLTSKNLTLMAKGQAKPLDNFNFDGKWLTFTISGVKSKQVIPGLWKTANVGRI